ncbi:MAG TPA: MBL fold metallo-hydrolase [Anaerolineales bacterium]|nr:MBL fold metallo-hydrolase [Anaerolineales bacterium]HNF35701.1 MBL fold metallo-hydrolase [Anaerolineales bacterium]HNH79534.1 MBL fold metallo-hydrolase [Anaerolineales bacterium]
MRISFHGAAHTVTGSQHLIEVNGSRLLLDCGLYQGKRADTYERNLNFSHDPRKVNAVILSHAHIDHAGNLPNLVKQGFEGPIYATRATVDLASLMISDSGHIQESDAEFVNKKRAQRGEEPIEPLYTKEDAEKVAGMFSGVNYGEAFEPIPGVVARFYEAGHILGSAGVSLDIEEKGKKTRLWFSGDIGRYKLPLLRDPVLPDRADYMIMESTYGDKSHNDPSKAFIEFRDVVKRTIERGGKVIVPAFAVGRTQELVYHLNEMMTEREIPSVPVFVDSPLAVNATSVFRNHPECYDEETRQFVLEARHPALDFKMLTYVKTVDESKALNERTDPMVIISASGMAETGRIVHHIRNNIENPKNTICIVSWQAPDTMGRRLADREPIIRIFGEAYKRKCDVATIGGLSGHAGQDLLMKYALNVKDSVKQIFLVHGEEKQAMTLKGLLKEQKLNQVHYPDLHESVEL